MTLGKPPPPKPHSGRNPETEHTDDVATPSRPWWKKKRFAIPGVFIALIVGASVAGGEADSPSTGSEIPANDALEDPAFAEREEQTALATAAPKAISGSASPSPAPTVRPTAVMRKPTWTDADIEYQLASIDAGQRLDFDDRRIADYAAALDEAEDSCRATSRTELADMAVTGVSLLADQGVPETNLGLLRALPEATAGTGLEGSLQCDELLAMIVTLVSG